MARIIDLACEVAALRDQYSRLHDAVFKWSIRRALLLPRLQKPVDYQEQQRQLAALAARLEEIGTMIAELDAGGLTIRGAFGNGCAFRAGRGGGGPFVADAFARSLRFAGSLAASMEGWMASPGGSVVGVDSKPERARCRC